MRSEEQSGILPLEPLSLVSIALTTHNVAWSPDAELAVSSDDSVFLYLPEFPSKGTKSKAASLADLETRRQYSEVALRFPAVELRAPELNRPLFGTAKQEFPDFEFTWEAGQSLVANIGSSLNHVVALEWSPNGLGRLKRSVLAVLTGSGALTIYCEGAANDSGSVKIKSRNIRTIGSWVAPWGVGGNLLLPRAKGHQSPYSMEHITSFAWARDLDRNGTLLAYMNDEDEIIILSVQSRHAIDGTENHPGDWNVEEVARFAGDGPHGKGDPADPDYMPSDSSFALRWSPWLQRPGGRTAILSYVTKNYVGFRQVKIKAPWKEWKIPEVEVQPYDCSGLCIHLAPDAFVTWEDLIWTKGLSKECRGVVATPFTVQSFSVVFDNAIDEGTLTKHSTNDCNTTYPSQEHVSHASNPITGLIVHPPDISKATQIPHFSLTRLSATPTNNDWYQTNLSLPSNPEEASPRPTWASEIAELLETKEAYPLAYRYHNPDGATKSESGAEGSNNGDEEEEQDDGLLDDEDEDDFDDFDDDEEPGKPVLFQESNDPYEGMEKIYTNRIRIWGMASSPGSGVTAVFATLYSAIKEERYTFAGLRNRVFFGRSLAPVDNGFYNSRKLSTEARAFEWMYGGGPPVPGVGAAHGTSTEGSSKRQAIKDAFRDLASNAACVLCGAKLHVQHGASKCPNGHTFANCAATGLPILAPGISNNCAVCGSKCLKPNEIPANAGDAATAFVKQISSELCGGCGGKFLNQ
ncbi:hypothetical protein BKA67DRAFT_529497 [Truncatella angustata]|uniref:Transcription factor IIIC 90kDa subunit N-terminal domain-containing protein n=1 Tax=Truncatella angustata TaxID=152316 RepID=A0A9P8UW99_9PEZI|nr:uncharacterized protein BKA67DRAFT_529497 [Truncatella angustata]KAH6659340.1 hypothetical protein BKA67DRAFT_529497 [Truncatella angustata]